MVIFPIGVECKFSCCLTVFIQQPPKGHWLIPFQHNDICSHSAGEINWYLQPIWAWEVFTSSILGINAEAFVSFYHAILNL